MSENQTVTNAELEAAFLAARAHGKILGDEVLRAVIVAAREAKVKRTGKAQAAVPASWCPDCHGDETTGHRTWCPRGCTAHDKPSLPYQDREVFVAAWVERDSSRGQAGGASRPMEWEDAKAWLAHELERNLTRWAHGDTLSRARYIAALDDIRAATAPTIGRMWELAYHVLSITRES